MVGTSNMRPGRTASALLAACIAGCALPDVGAVQAPEPMEEPTCAQAWSAALRDLGEYPVLPPSEDVYVGDVYVLPQPPPPPPETGAEEPHVTGAPRWKSLPVQADLRDAARRRSRVGLRATGALTPAGADLESFVPAEIAPLVQGPAASERLALSLQAGDAESQSLSVDALLEHLVDRDDGGARPRLKQEHLATLSLGADASTGHAYLSVVSEVIYVRSMDAVLRRLDGTETALEPGDAAIRRAAALNAALARSGLTDRLDGSLEFTLATDDAAMLRRRWTRPLAVAVRGVTLDVDRATGEVLRMGPLGVELPPFESAEEQEQDLDESLVLEERRRGAEAEAPAREYLGKTRWYWDFGPRYDALDGDLSLYIGGRLHLDAASFSANDEIDAAFGPPDPGFNVRRAYLELGGVYKQFDFNFWLAFSDADLRNEGLSSVDFRNVFVGVNGVSGLGSVHVGYLKEPFGLEENTSSNDITFMERSLTNAFVEGRNLGVLAQRRLTENRRMTVALGVFRSANNDLDVGTGQGVTGRVTGAPILSEDGRRVLHLGASATYRDPGSDGLQFSQRPESAQAQVMADTGTFAVDRDVRVGAELGAVLGSLSFQSEAIVAAGDGGGTGVGDPTFWSSYLTTSYVLGGGHRSYRDRIGAFGTVDPERPFGKGGRGTVELAGRYSYLDLDSAGIDGGRLHDWTLGLNWYANRSMRVMLNGIAAHPEGFGTEYVLQARLQLTL